MIDALLRQYPRAMVWAFGDSPTMADELAALVIEGCKTASCCALDGLPDEERPVVGGFNIILDGQGRPVCVTRTTALRTVPFDEVSAELAYKEGEGDRTLVHWQREHRAFFEREGCFSAQMLLLFEEFECIDIIASH